MFFFTISDHVPPAEQLGAINCVMPLTIRTVQPNDWPSILTIQDECYHALEPESLAVLQDKVKRAPTSCWVATSHGEVLGYLLCHPWPHASPPPLDTPLPSMTEAEIFYLHDLAIASKARGMGAGMALLDRALSYATANGFSKAALVAVQNAPAFWQKQGFNETPCPKSLDEYGSGARYMTRRLHDSVNAF